MKDLLTTAFLNLWRRKLRAFLTVLGMVIGGVRLLEKSGGKSGTWKAE